MLIILKYLVFGALAALALTLLAKVFMAKLLQREEDYYGEGVGKAMIESADFFDPDTPMGDEAAALMDEPFEEPPEKGVGA